jgi:hypothetical protein
VVLFIPIRASVHSRSLRRLLGCTPGLRNLHGDRAVHTDCAKFTGNSFGMVLAHPAPARARAWPPRQMDGCASSQGMRVPRICAVFIRDCTDRSFPPHSDRSPKGPYTWRAAMTSWTVRSSWSATFSRRRASGRAASWAFRVSQEGKVPPGVGEDLLAQSYFPGSALLLVLSRSSHTGIPGTCGSVPRCATSSGNDLRKAPATSCTRGLRWRMCCVGWRGLTVARFRAPNALEVR